MPPADSPTTFAIIPPPKPYRLLKSGGVVIVSKNSEGDEETTTVYENPVYPLRRVRNEEHRTEQLIWRVEHKHGGVLDFVLEGDRRSMHVLNAVSPAFTCAFPFAGHVCDRIEHIA